MKRNPWYVEWIITHKNISLPKFQGYFSLGSTLVLLIVFLDCSNFSLRLQEGCGCHAEKHPTGPSHKLDLYAQAQAFEKKSDSHQTTWAEKPEMWKSSGNKDPPNLVKKPIQRLIRPYFEGPWIRTMASRRFTQRATSQPLVSRVRWVPLTASKHHHLHLPLRAPSPAVSASSWRKENGDKMILESSWF